jgi:predicted alpha/beta superfamily hydrolase
MRSKKSLLCFVLLWIGCAVAAQYKVQFLVTRLPSYHKATDKIYLAGSFNNWNPKDENYLLIPTTDHSSITIELPRGVFEYKFTKGGWDKVESGNEGFPTENRRITVESDTTIQVIIGHWADHFTSKPKQSTATKNVHVLDTAFYMPQLDRHRRIWIYLPSSYPASQKKYPVLYMHDGQNVFDNATSGFGEWGVDEALDSLGPRYGEMIVVAIDNGSDKRLNEYAPYDMEKYGQGQGDAYVDFLVNTLQPYINKHYRTKTSARYTAVAGSSMGGLISFYALLKYPRKFGSAGVFSPAFWINPQLKNIDPHKAKKIKGKIYFFAGQQESDTMVPDMLNVFEQLHQYSKARIQTVIRAEGKHNEATWRAELPLFFKWLEGSQK